MTPATIIREAQADGVKLALSTSGTVKVSGDGAAVNRWLAVIRERKPEIINVLEADAVTSWVWLLHFADREPMEVYCNPDATHAEILERYPEALAAEPIPERIAPAYEVVWPDVEAFSGFNDDRRTCGQCVNLAGRRCLAAWRGEIAANRDYAPVRDIPRRCEGYTPGTDDPDTRPGQERWPELNQERGE